MKSTVENEVLTIFLEGLIDTTNAHDIEQEITEIAQNNGHDSLVLDLTDLEYISSAGLRVMLVLAKSEKDLKLINALPEVYDVFEMTGFDEMIPISKKPREFSTENLKLIGAGATGKVYRLDNETILKVFNKDIDEETSYREKERAKTAFFSGIPTAIPFDVVNVGDQKGIIFEMLNADTLEDLLLHQPATFEENLKGYAEFLHDLHQIEVSPETYNSVKNDRLTKMVPVLGLRGDFTEEDIDRLKTYIKSLPDDHTFLHGDSNSGNIMIQNGEYVLIDMNLVGYGSYLFDLVSPYLTLGATPDKNDRTIRDPNAKEEDDDTMLFRKFLRYYHKTDDEAFIDEELKRIAPLGDLVLIVMYSVLEGLYSPEKMAQLREMLRKDLDNVEKMAG